MRLAHWVPCDPPLPDQRRQMIHLCELVVADEDDLSDANFYVDPFNAFAYSKIRGKWARASMREEDAL